MAQPIDAAEEYIDSFDRLDEALEEANIPTLLMVLAHLTGSDRWLCEPYRPVRTKGIGDNDTGGLSTELQDEVRAAAAHATREYHAGRLQPRELSPTKIAGMLAFGLAEPVSVEYGPLLAEELGVVSRDVALKQTSRARSLRVGIIGAGISGLCAAIKLRGAGIDFEVIEKNLDVGGTWYENQYPGCGVDTPSHFYSFSFAPNTKWERYFAKQGEVEEYLTGLVDRFDIRERISFGKEVTSAQFDSTTCKWIVISVDRQGQTSTDVFDVLLTGVGMVNRPAKPAISGLETFAGPVLHTAEWDPDLSLDGKRVVVVGTGASSMQLVPAIADVAAHVTVFQRSKQWALPNPNYRREITDSLRYLMETVPFYHGWYRLRVFWNYGDRLHDALTIDPNWQHPERSVSARNERHRVFLTDHVRSELGDRTDLIPECVPDYPPYGKRPLIDNSWFRTVCRDDVSLVSRKVTEVTEKSVIDSEGVEYPADVVVLATGFKALQFLWPMEIRGASGRRLTDAWGADDAKAHVGVTVPDFPNLFILNGPNTNAGHGGSAILAIELQVRYVMQAIAHLIETDVAAVDVRPEVYESYNVKLDRTMDSMVWSHRGMTTYYRNAAGRVVLSSPWKYAEYWSLTRNFDPSEHVSLCPGAATPS